MLLLVTFDFDEMNVLQKFRSLCLVVKHTYLARELVILQEMQGKLGELQAWLQSHASAVSQKMSNMYE